MIPDAQHPNSIWLRRIVGFFVLMWAITWAVGRWRRIVSRSQGKIDRRPNRQAAVSSEKTSDH